MIISANYFTSITAQNRSIYTFYSIVIIYYNATESICYVPSLIQSVASAP